MPTIDKPINGKFCWIEANVDDPKAAQAFYGEIFGWSFDEMPMPQGTYAMGKIGSSMTAGVMKLADEAKKMGAPPHWLSYIACEDTDASTEKAKGLGGTILVPPMDVGPGRMSVVRDPTGGVFALWHAKESMGNFLSGETGALCWTELATTNVDAAGKFYATLFGWKTEAMSMGPMVYTIFKVGTEQVGGMMAMPKEMAGAPTSWTSYFMVKKTDDTINLVKKLGGKLLSPAVDLPNIGRFAVLQDPQGAVFAVLQPPAS